jgi:hypothetical protein
MQGDRSEFNQCQSQLILLYSDGLGGCVMEFMAYRILYYVFNNSSEDTSHMLASLTLEEEDDAAVSHALQVRRLTWSSFCACLRSYSSLPLWLWLPSSLWVSL